MQRTIYAISTLSTLLALSAITAPQATACRVPDVSTWKPTLALPLESFGAPAPAQTSTTIVGLWFIRFSSEGFVVDEAFDVWHSDRTEVLNDYTNPIEGNVCLGVWTQTGQTYQLKHPSWTFDTSGNLTGTSILKESVTLGLDSNSFSGTYTLDFFDTSGNPIVRYQGAVQATRITPN